MGKIFISKNTKIEINELRSQGLTDQDVYNQLSEKYYDKDELAQAIYYTIKPDNFNKIKYYYYTLIFLTTIIVTIKSLWAVYFDEHYFLFGIPLYYFKDISHIVNVLNLIFLFSWRPQQATFLFAIFSFASLYLVNISFKIYEFGAIYYLSGVPYIISLILTLILCYLCYKILKKGFPNVPILSISKIPKNSNNEYIFE